ncbi:MAG: hypothetical protein QHJ73_15330, partial [Armatimonadota bacterium]|nr:hypothetical protein [Armatimonadota bacterium]
IVRRWLETDEEYRMPPGADFLLGPPEDGIVRGMSLPEEVLGRIYRGNFQRLVGTQPKALNPQLAAEECDRLASECAALSGKPASETAAAEAARALRR